MTRQDLFNEYADVFFALAPRASEADDPISREDVEDLRRKLVAIGDRVSAYLAMDAAFEAEEEADMVLGQERDEVGRG